MADTFHFELISPEQTLVSADLSEAVLPRGWCEVARPKTSFWELMSFAARRFFQGLKNMIDTSHAAHNRYLCAATIRVRDQRQSR
jgi:hypothetical protein